LGENGFWYSANQSLGYLAIGLDEEKLGYSHDLILLYLLTPLGVVNIEHDKVHLRTILFVELADAWSQRLTTGTPVSIELNQGWLTIA